MTSRQPERSAIRAASLAIPSDRSISACAVGAKRAACVQAERRPELRGHELVESGELVLERVEPRSRPAERARHDEDVAGLRAGPAGTRALRPSAVTPMVTLSAAFVSPPTTGTPGSFSPSYSATTSSDGGLGRNGERDEQRLGRRSHCGEIGEVDRRGLVAEVAPGAPVEPEVPALDEQVLRDDEPVREERRVVADPADEPTPLELPEELELTEPAEREPAWPWGRWRPGHRYRRAARPRTSTGSGARAQDVAGPHGLGRDLRGGARRVLQALAAREQPGQRGGVGAAGAVGRVVAVAFDGDRHVALAVVEPVHRLVPVAARDDHRGGAELDDPLGEQLPRRAQRVGNPGEHTRLVQIRRDHRRERKQVLDERRHRVLAQEPRAEAATMTGSTTSGTLRPVSTSATVSTIGALKSIPVFAASTPMSSQIASSWARMNGGGAS